MAIVDHPSMKALISKITQYAKQVIENEDQYGLFSRFLRLFYSHGSETDLSNRPIPVLYSMAYSHFQLISQPLKPGQCNIRVFNPDLERDGFSSTHTVVELIMKDSPFIVDSVRMELNRLGFTIHLMIHMGGMKIIRDSQGNLTDVAAYDETASSAGGVEAPVYVEIDRQTDPDVLQMITENLQRVLHDVQIVVADWKLMRARVVDSIAELSETKAPIPADTLKESIVFLQWLLDDQFTFLGVRDYEVVGSGEAMEHRLIPGSGLGVLRDETHSKVSRPFIDMPELARELILSPKELLIISKTNTISTVHRLAYTDYIGIKRFDENGKLIGERRLLGLYTSTAYNSQPKQIPFLRHKVTSIMQKSGLPPKSHAGKELMHILDTFPRDDLFQGSVEDLYRIARGVMNLQDRRKVSVFVRQDVYGRFVSCLVYVPRDNFNSQLIMRIQDVLMDAFHGIEANYSTYFHTAMLTRIHYVIRVRSRKKLRFNKEELQARLSEVGKSWQDGFKEYAIEHFGEEHGNQIVKQYMNAFSAGYREDFSPMHAVGDIEHIEMIPSVDKLGMSLYRPLDTMQKEIKFKLYRFEQTVPLSDALPILENMGLRVIGEQPYELIFKDGRQLWINDFSMIFPKDVSFELEAVHEIFQDAFQHIWSGAAESDLLNALVLEAQLNWREIAVLRAYTRYLRQTGFTFSQEYVAQTFVKYPLISRAFIDLFHHLFNPVLQDKLEDSKIAEIDSQLQKQIDDVVFLDEDRIFRRVLAVIKATLRTNFYQPNLQGGPKINFAFKLAPEKIPELPLPLPKFEIFVYSPRFEGVHLRSSKVARGGLRWSDRREDFRTEVLGLMKAQQVKNAVIVPSGAKGGFVPKNLPADAPRDAIMQEGIACYKGFVQALLDITDNINGAKTIPPKAVVCYDEPDPYLVVAADKGTATFSDIANQIAVDNHFWLGDAFASGGSTGYDHKKMGITARGAWVSAERHFQGLGIDVNNTEITVVGIGDLSGDVFGNGVLLSHHLKLVAAFNHMHIFLDPTPDPEKSFLERKRMFELSRSTWTDYDTKIISEGGGVYSRTAKYITLTPQVKTLLGITEERLSPTDLIRAILKAPVDMLWNGGIGTYVKSIEETHLQVGDRANDGVRINGAELRARVVVEGGNLGFTQLGRIEYAALGGLINTDFIDNSGGVDCSDHEVNIKILLNAIMEAGELTEKQRNQLLASMSDEVANLVLQNNYHQNQSVSFLTKQSPKNMNLYMNYLEAQERAGKINRQLEHLPTDKIFLERKGNGIGLTAPEIAVLFSYSKIILKEDMRQSDLLDDPVLMKYMKTAFPMVLDKKYSQYIYKHRLHREILATQLSNHLISNSGITFVYQLVEETGASISEIVRAFIVAFDIFHIHEMIADIDALDYSVDMALQYQMLEETYRLLGRATRWILRNCRTKIDIAKMVDHYSPYTKGLYKRLPKLLLGTDKASVDQRREQLVTAGVPEDLAGRMAAARSMYHVFNIIQAADSHKADVYQVAQVYFMLVDRLDLHWFRDRIDDHPASHRWAVLAKASYKADLDHIQQKLTMSVLASETATKSVSARVNAWLLLHESLVLRWRSMLVDLRNEDIPDFSIVSVGLRELADLVSE